MTNINIYNIFRPDTPRNRQIYADLLPQNRRDTAAYPCETTDQIVLYILRVAPTDIMDEQFSQQVTEFLLGKLQMLLSVHSGGCNKTVAALL